jgi:hypothetical protein
MNKSYLLLQQTIRAMNSSKILSYNLISVKLTTVLLIRKPMTRVFAASPIFGYQVFKNEVYKVVDIECVNAD